MGCRKERQRIRYPPVQRQKRTSLSNSRRREADSAPSPHSAPATPGTTKLSFFRAVSHDWRRTLLPYFTCFTSSRLPHVFAIYSFKPRPPAYQKSAPAPRAYERSVLHLFSFTWRICFARRYRYGNFVQHVRRIVPESTERGPFSTLSPSLLVDLPETQGID